MVNEGDLANCIGLCCGAASSRIEDVSLTVLDVSIVLYDDADMENKMKRVMDAVLDRHVDSRPRQWRQRQCVEGEL